MADKIVSWGGFDSKGTSGMGITGSLIITGSSSSTLLEIDSPASNNILFVSGSGNVGINTGTPSRTLEVNGTIGTTADGIGRGITMGTAVPGGSSYLNVGQGTGWLFHITTNSATYTANSTRLTVTDNGVGFGNFVANGGTVSATAHIRGSGTTSSTTSLLVQNANATNMLSLTDNGALTVNTFQTSSTAITVNRTAGTMGNFNAATMGSLVSLIDTAGNSNGSKTTLYINTTGASVNRAIEAYGGVGIGLTPPDNQFQVAYPTQINSTVTAISTNNNYVLTLKSLTSFASNAGTGISFWGDDRGQGGAVSAFAGIRGVKENSTYLNSLGNLVFYVQTGSADARTESTYKETARFNSSGYFGIGTSTPSTPLHVSGSSIITDVLAVGTGSIGPSENTLTLGARDTGGEGGQLGLNASGGTYTSASFIDNWQNKLRVLKGTNAGSSAEVANFDLQTLYLNLPGGAVTMPQRPAFRVTGSSGFNPTIGTVISGSSVGIDYNQGSYYNNTNGQFTCPVAGLYHVWYVGRTYAASLASVALFKNNTGTPLAFWESNANSGHFGTSAVVSLAANDVITAKVTAGQVTFDGNDNWGAAYIG